MHDEPNSLSDINSCITCHSEFLHDCVWDCFEEPLHKAVFFALWVICENIYDITEFDYPKEDHPL